MPRSLPAATLSTVAAIVLFTASLPVAQALSIAASKPAGPSAAIAPVTGVVADSTGAIVPGAEVDLLDPNGAVAVASHSDGQGDFHLSAPKAGQYMLVVTAPGFDAVRRPVMVAPPPLPTARVRVPSPITPGLHIILPLAAVATNVQVNADTGADLTAGDENNDTSVMTANDIKALPIFDNDYATAMSAFLDSGSAGTSGSGLLVDGVEAGRVPVSASAVQEIRINEDPYSAQYYWPGRGQMEIITKSAADHYHGQLNFYFRDSALNATEALAATKPFEQRRIYEGSILGPIPHAASSGFLASFTRAEEDVDSIVYAFGAASPNNPTGTINQNVAAPTRDTEFSLRASHQFGEKHSVYAQYAYKEWAAQNQGVGGQTLGDAAYNAEYREDDVILHADSVLSPSVLNQGSFVLERNWSRNQDANERPHVNVNGYFASGSAQNDAFTNQYNGRLSDMVTWTRGRHLLKFGIGVPNFNRRVLEDDTNSGGTYTFGPTVDAKSNVVATALSNYDNNRPSTFTQNTGVSRFVYHQQEAGGFVQDQVKLTSRFSVTPGLRYDWQNFLPGNRTAFSPRLSFAYVLNQKSETVVRGGGGVYYDRFGSGPLADLARYRHALRRSIVVSLDPAREPATGCVPVADCVALTDQPPNLVELAPDTTTPYQIQYGLSIERKIGQSGELSVSGYSTRDLHAFRSVDINAPTPESGYTERPDPEYARIRQIQTAGFMDGNGLDIQYHGRYNRYVSGFARYTWSHYGSDTEGIGWFPQNQYDPGDEWASTSWNRRNRLGLYGVFNQDSVLNLSVGLFANSGAPWTPVTGTDSYGDGLYNERPDGVARDSELGPDYVDLDLRWGHDFAITPKKTDESPHLGLSAAAFNVLNHENGSLIDTVETSSTFGEITAANPPRRLQLGMRFEF
ncbi:MAG TPA: TonB-dependent receptor [Acidobacteriaceae bacterium]|nr:TonB-dependent receptor [Acidobacteriaceae bacterium]